MAAGGERKRRRRRKLQLSKLFTLSAKACFKPAHSEIGRSGFSRVVYCNQPESSDDDYCDNYVRTTKYTLPSFLPKSLFEQFRRVANFYFLVVGILSLTPLAPYTAVSAIVPLTFVILATMVKEGVEDWRRKQQDIEVNSRKVGVHRGNGDFDLKEWKTLRVGDIVKVEKNDFFPADLVLLSSSYEDAVCYVETMNLDGETNLKLKQGLEVTMSMSEEVDFRDFVALIKCEDPNANLYSFVGTMELKGAKYPLSPQQLLLRGSKLRNTDYIYGVVIFTGPDTKVVQNSTEPPSKRSMIERKMDKIIYLMFLKLSPPQSVIVRDEDGKLLLLCKGADSVMFERLSGNGREYEEETRDHVNEYADAGLRTLILAYRELDEIEYEVFTERISEAKSSVSADREALIDEVTEKIEKDLVLLGATAVEDKLQNGVPDCIDKLAQAGIKIWVLTGDKMETAINIGFACSLLRREMKQIIINLETPEIQQLEKSGEKDVIAEALKENVLRQITNGKVQVKNSGGNSEAFALIIDGKSLAYALEDDLKYMFLEEATGCASVICCRSSPKQKALVTRLVKNGSGQTTLAIGDGANDVGMLQEADIGVGISGVEGLQAVMSSDIAIAQFRYLERLLLVHGHWCYRRISKMICYFFYKNITFGFTLFLYEAYTSFSTTPAYNDWYLSLYSVLFSSLPVICLGIFDQDVSARFCLKFPVLYQEGVQNLLFSCRGILSWMFHGFCSAIIIFFLCKTSLESQAFNHQGKPAGRDTFGGTMYTCVVWVVSLQMVLTISYFTVIQHLVVWGSVVVWYLFLTVYGSLPPRVSTDAYMVFLEVLAPSPSYWITTLFVVMSTMMPYFVFSVFRCNFSQCLMGL
nr:PREDICTED: probable phospholipid-transporting ATPase 12 [Raphanus sativus]